MSGTLLEWALGPAGKATARAILVAQTGAALLLTMRRRASARPGATRPTLSRVAA